MRSIKEFSSRDYATFKEIAQDFLSNNSISGEHIIQATFGVAGAVIDGHSKLTNLQWELDEKELSQVLDIQKVKLLNDLEAAAYYIPFLRESEQKSIYEGARCHSSFERSATAAIIAAGTGLGEAFLTWDDKHHHQAHASEGGHCDFAPTSELEDQLLRYLRKKFGHVSYELVCSGKGIYNSWSYFHESEGLTHPEDSPLNSSKLSEQEDPTRVIVDAIMKEEGNKCKACARTLETFLSVLGAESGNLALKFVARNGVYIAGGLTRVILPALTNGQFMKAYLAKGRMSRLVSQIPVIAILTPNSTLFGAAHYALDSLEFREEAGGPKNRQSAIKVQEA